MAASFILIIFTQPSLALVIDPPQDLPIKTNAANAGSQQAMSCKSTAMSTAAEFGATDAASEMSVKAALASLVGGVGMNAQAENSAKAAEQGSASLAAEQGAISALQAKCTAACTQAHSAIAALVPPPAQNQTMQMKWEEVRQSNLAVTESYKAYCTRIGTQVTALLSASGAGMKSVDMSSMMMAQMMASTAGQLGNSASSAANGNSGSGSSTNSNTTYNPSLGGAATPPRQQQGNATTTAQATQTAQTAESTSPTAQAASTASNGGVSTASASTGFTAPAETATTSTRASQTGSLGVASAPGGGTSGASRAASSLIPMSGPQCLARLEAGTALLNSPQCTQGLQASCNSGALNSLDQSICQNFTHFYCGTGVPDSRLLSPSSALPAGQGRVNSYSLANSIMNSQRLPALTYCQSQLAKDYCAIMNADSGRALCLSCRALRGAVQVNAQDVRNAKLNCLSDPVFQAGVYDVLLSVLPATATGGAGSSAAPVVPRTNSIIGANPVHN